MFCIFCEFALTIMDECELRSTLILVMAWGYQATSHNLSLWGPRFMSILWDSGLMSSTGYAVSDITTAHGFRMTNTLIFQSNTNIPFSVGEIISICFIFLPRYQTDKATYVLTHHLLELLFYGCTCTPTLTPLTHQRWGDWPWIQLFGW